MGPQFGLRQLFLWITVLGVLFAVLAALGLSPVQIGWGLFAMGVAAVVAMGLVHFIWSIQGGIRARDDGRRCPQCGNFDPSLPFRGVCFYCLERRRMGSPPHFG